MSFNKTPSSKMMLGAVLGLVAAMVFYFGAPKSAGLQVLATLMLLASLIFFILPADLSPSSAIQAILKQTPNRRRPPVSTTISCIAVLFVVVSTMGYMTYGMFTRVSLYIAEQEWPSTDATVVSCHVGEGHNKHGTYWYPGWVYSFIVGGTSYLSRDNGEVTHSLKAAELKAATRPPGYHLLTYYDPQNPQRTALYRRDPNGVERPFLSFLIILFSLMASIFALACIVVASALTVKTIE